MDFTHPALRDILGAEYDFQSVIDEDLMERMVGNTFISAAIADALGTPIFTAQANGTPTNGGATSVLTIDTITNGVFERDDQYNDMVIEVTSGAASGAGIFSKFPVISCDETGQTFTVGENENGDNLNEAGMADNDQFRVTAHVHNGTYGERVLADDLDTTLVGSSFFNAFVNVDNGANIIAGASGSGLRSVASQVPVSTSNIQGTFGHNHKGGVDPAWAYIRGRQPGGGTYRDRASVVLDRQLGLGTTIVSNSALWPVNQSRQIDAEWASGNESENLRLLVTGYQL